MSSDVWVELEESILKCTKCRLHLTRNRAVPGEGRRDSRIVFIGEAPGEKEDIMGRPFVGAAGKLLTELIELIGYRREDFYITNIVKCRPPNNRDPEEDEIESCLPYLTKQLELIKPRAIIALGRHAARTLFKLAGLKWSSMNTAHGRVYAASLLGLNVDIVPEFHPASALYNPPIKNMLVEDFVKVVKPVIEKALSESHARKQHKTLFDYVSGNPHSPS